MGTRKIFEVYENGHLLVYGTFERICRVLPMERDTFRKYLKEQKVFEDKYTFKEAEKKKKTETEDPMLRSLKYYGNTIAVEEELSQIERIEKELNKKISVEKRTRIWEGKNEGYYYYLEVV